MKRFSQLIVLSLLLLSPISADPLVTDFFHVTPPEGWQTSRTTSGLWQLERDLPFDMKATFLMNRLKTTQEMYLQGTLQLWKTQGETELSFDGRRMECLITPAEGDPLFKYVTWKDDLLVVATFMFPVKHTDEALNSAHGLIRTLQITDPVFKPNALRDTVADALEQHRNTAEELADAAAIRKQMTSFRQDWEPYFTESTPLLYQAYLAYLEARYDAAFVVEHGEEMGMPESLLESRLKSVENRRSELMKVLYDND